MSIAGMDAESSFACKAPDGILCESMSGIYVNAQADNLPGQRVKHRGEAATPNDLSHAKGVIPKPIYSGMPIRSSPRMLRVWFAPWEDSDGDLHDQSFVYLSVDYGRWLIEHNQHRILEAYRPVRAPANAVKQSTEPGASAPGQNTQDEDRQRANFLDGVATPETVLPKNQ